MSSSHSQRYRNVRRFLDPTRRLARILTSRGESPVLTGGIGNFHTGCPSPWMQGFMLSGLKTRNPLKGAGMSSLTFSPLFSTSKTL